MKQECKQCDFTKPVRKGRGWWVCPDCGRDYSIELVAYWDAIDKEEYNQLKALDKTDWKPEFGEWIWLPSITYIGFCYFGPWSGDKQDKQNFKNGLVFRTNEEAKKRAKEILKLIK